MMPAQLDDLAARTASFLRTARGTEWGRGAIALVLGIVLGLVAGLSADREH